MLRRTIAWDTGTVTSHTGNDDQSAYWSGAGGRHWVAEHRQYDTMLAAFGAEVRRVLDVRPGERIADIGCGTGAMSQALAADVGPAGDVVGFDISATMIEGARNRAGERDNLRFAVADAQADPLDPGGAGFDGVFSRFGVMFFADPVAAFVNIAGSVRSGGRLAFACWREEAANAWVAVPSAIMRSFTPQPLLPLDNQPGPFAFRNGERVHAILDSAGWANIRIEQFDADTVMGSGEGLDAAVAHAMGNRVGQALRDQVDDDTFAAATVAVREALSAHVHDGVVVVPGSVWIVTADRP
ncbi:MAG TPA: methyltransferase domain-containing protein [Ilumatobacteraceae bacterium]